MTAVEKLELRLRALRSTGRKGIAPYLTAGDGGSQVTLAVLLRLRPAVPVRILPLTLTLVLAVGARLGMVQEQFGEA